MLPDFISLTPPNFPSKRESSLRQNLKHMASTLRNSGASRISTAAAALYSDNQSLIADIRKSISIFKGIAVDLEKDEKPDKVKQLEDAVLVLLETYDDCIRFSHAIQSIGNSYLPSDQPTDFKKALEDEVVKLKASLPFAVQNNPLFRNFKEAVWVPFRLRLF